MSLLAMIADNFELEPPPRHPDDLEYFRPVDEEPNSKSLDNDLISTNDYDDKGLSQPLLLDRGESVRDMNGKSPGKNKDDTKLLLSFILMLVIGTLNKIFQKLQAIPMYNYPNSLNLLQNFIYVPLCFMYIIPVSYFGLFNNAIPNEVATMNKKPFIVMGLLDCITCLFMTFAAVYLPGSLLILLPQASIPISMLLSNRIKGEKYKPYQYLGALVVILGIVVVLEPLLTQRHASDYTCQAIDEEEFCSVCSVELEEEGCLSHRTKGNGLMEFQYVTFSQDADDSSSEIDDPNGSICMWIPTASAGNSSSESSSTLLIWSIITILACIPMTLSSIYKEMILSDPSNTVDIDPIFLNGWVAFYQFLFSFPMAFPAGMTSNPPVTPSELPSNIYDGIKCYLGDGTITGGCHPDDQCYQATLYVNLFLVFNVGFNILIIYILKFGSANVLFMAGTVMVPVGNIAFALPFMPGSMPLQDSDIAGLFVILTGLVTYRFGSSFSCCQWFSKLCPWRRGENSCRGKPDLPLNKIAFHWDAPMKVGCDDFDNVPPPEVMKSLLSRQID